MEYQEGAESLKQQYNNDPTQIKMVSESNSQTADQGSNNIPEGQKPLYSKDDLEQILAETLRIAIDIVKAKKQYVTQPQGQSSLSYQPRQNYYQYGQGPSSSSWQRPQGGQVNYGGAGFSRAPNSFYRN